MRRAREGARRGERNHREDGANDPSETTTPVISSSITSTTIFLRWEFTHYLLLRIVLVVHRVRDALWHRLGLFYFGWLWAPPKSTLTLKNEGLVEARALL